MVLRWFLTFLLFAFTAVAEGAPFVTYHEADCPSVNTTRMTRMKRSAAVYMGLVPAADCHPNAPVKYLGVGPAGFSSSMSDSYDRPKTEHVSGYTRADGTVVGPYDRAPRR
jgi:hypothetical protein